jgi:hypothetical protein
VNTYTIERVNRTREWTGKFGPMISYFVELAELGEHELAQKPDTPAPVAGQTLTGTIEPPNREGFPPKLKRAQQPGGGYGPRPEDPQRARRIVRQHSQHMALLYAQIRADQGQLPETFTLGDLFKIADAFDKDAGIE